MKSFFGDCDRKGGTPHGNIVNTNPLWTKDKVIMDLKDGIRDIEMEEDQGVLSPRVRANKNRRKKKMETTLTQITASNPVGKIKGKDLDLVKKAVTSFEEEVKSLNPSHLEDEMALKGKSNVNPTQQGYYAKTPCIKLKNESEVEIAKACNMKIDERGMVSKDDVTRGIWMLERVLGLAPNHLRLKRDRPLGYMGKSSSVLVPELPADMAK